MLIGLRSFSMHVAVLTSGILSGCQSIGGG